MVRSTTSLPLALALVLAGCHVTIVPAPVAPADSNPDAEPVDTSGLRPARPFPGADSAAPATPAPARIVVVSPDAWAGRVAHPLVVEPEGAVRVVGRIVYDGRVEAVRVNGERAAMSRSQDGETRFVAVVRTPRRGSADVRVEVTTHTGKVSAAYPLKVGDRSTSLPKPPDVPPDGPPDIEAPPADTGVIVRPRRPVDPPPADSAAASTSAADSAWAQRDRWALVIGIDDYAADDVPARRYAAEDARAMAAFLRSPAAGSIPAGHVRTLINGDATRAAIRAALTGFLAQAGPEDVVIVYLSATGAPDPSHPNAAFVLPHDAAAASASDATAVSAEWLAGTLAGLDAHQKILLADVLYAGERKGNRRVQNLVHRTLVRTSGPRKGGIVAITSGGDEASSREGAQWGGGHGVFTHHVLTGLGGEGDGDGDGIITLAELVQHAREKVEGATGGSQKPAVSAAAYDRLWPMSVDLK